MLSRLAVQVLLCSYIFFSVKSQQYEGDECSLGRQPPGVCSLLKDCPVVYAQLLAGNQPERLCGFSHFDPIVCCPRQAAPIATTTSRTVLSGPSRPTSIARAKCAEYARAVYALETPPTLSGNRHQVNISLCAVKSKKLIVGGKQADPKEFPHMTAIGFDGRSKGIIWGCGGSLVSERFVMTAAHCLYSPQWGNAVIARVGDLNLATTMDDARPQDRRIVERIKHPRYKRPLEYHDIALLKLDSPVKFNAWVRPACLPTRPPERVDKAVATGWGRVDWADDEGSNNLRKVTLNTVAQNRCNSSFFSGGTDTRLNLGIVGDWQLCAGQQGKDTCQGDSGGPLAIFNEEQECMYDVIGITSLGRLCGSNVPGVYTRVYHYVPWLEQIIWS